MNSDITEVRKIDGQTGEIKTVMQKRGTQLNNLGEFACFAQEKLRLITTTYKLSKNALRTFLFIAGSIDWFDTYSASQQYIARQLGISSGAASRALSELVTAHLVRKDTVFGQTHFTINPAFVTKGKRYNQKKDSFAEHLKDSAAARLSALVEQNYAMELNDYETAKAHYEKYGTAEELRRFHEEHHKPTYDEIARRLFDNHKFSA